MKLSIAGRCSTCTHYGFKTGVHQEDHPDDLRVCAVLHQLDQYILNQNGVEELSQVDKGNKSRNAKHVPSKDEDGPEHPGTLYL